MMRPSGNNEAQSLFPSYRNELDLLEDDGEEMIDFLTDTELSSLNNNNHHRHPSVHPSTWNSAHRQDVSGNFSNFDPFSPEKPPSKVQSSLLDDEAVDDESHNDDVEASIRQSLSVPGAAGYLEMEEEPPRTPKSSSYQPKRDSHQTDLSSQYEPIKTSSGLLLTHRKTPNEYRPPPSTASAFPLESEAFDEDDLDLKKRQTPRGLFGSSNLRRALYQERFEFERGNPFQSGSVWFHGPRLMSYTKLWLMVSATVFFIGMMVVAKHVRHEGAAASESILSTDGDALIEFSENVRLVPLENQGQYYYQGQQQDEQYGPIVLLPLPAEARPRGDLGHPHQQETPMRRLSMKSLRHQFDSWASKLNKRYHSQEEKERRFGIWLHNNERIAEKNRRHGPCKLTNQPVFGSNPFQDLTHEEFKEQFLTGYTGPTTDKLPRDASSGVLGPHIEPKRHPEVHRLLQARWEDTVTIRRKASDSGAFGTSCKWYDVSCVLTYVFETYVYGLGLTLEPAFDSESYPKSVDWRDLGAVNSLRSQGNCGACWAITAIENIESAIFISTGTLYTLSETEVITCADECEMCAGGWPQEAVEYVMKHNGVPLSADLPYDADWLLSLSNVKAGESGDLTEDDLNDYRSEVCPAGDDKKSGSRDEGNVYASGSTYQRFGGTISGYGYATKKCVCYTDGTGCECDSQDEGMAVRNIATYGPAVVCFDASTWKEYTGGIITSESGCSSGFMDVNHCAQVVGYAYATADSDDGRDENAKDKEGGSQDSEISVSQGYWIVRNQWSRYWGMNGYAYVAMGENTCGILNDMLIAYT